ncbi:MAG: DUF1800 domain-containing protein [Candidatus Melainabacteria bacterium]|nr:MAG: DUF1800 domain-containing protein [Candidatus Melainabacteria bacterium]
MHSKTADGYWVEHLLRRAGFGSTSEELAYYKGLGFEASVEALTSPDKVKDDKLADILSKQDFDFTDLGDVKRWWIYRMAYTKRPLEEKMTLFWHGHFATSNAKVANPYLMYQQNELFRRNALGDYQQMLLDVSRDPAMIVWLDNQQNRKGKPNENYAREIMELFTMGIGNYTEMDIKEAARAFTGWAAPSGFYFNKKQHDAGEKTFLGQKGTFNGDDICTILANKDATARYISKKLISFLAYDDPDDDIVERISEVYLSSSRNIRAVVKAILLDKSFRTNKSYHCKIKSPVELVVGTVKALQVQKLDGDLSALMARMGQNLLEPPNVKGWDGGMAWIATDTMMERFNYAARISTQKFDTTDGYINPVKLAKNYNVSSASDMVDNLLVALVDGDVPHNTRKKLLAYVAGDASGKVGDGPPTGKALDVKMRGLIHLIMTLPSYQLA